MTGRTAETSYDVGPQVGVWAVLSRRLSPYLDLVVGLAAAALAVAALLNADLGTLDPRLEPPDPLAVAVTLAAGLSLVWRRTRPATSFTVFVVGCLVVTLTNHYIGLLSVLLLFSLYSLAAHGRRRDGLVGLALSVTTFAGLAVADAPDLRTADVVEACALLLTAWAVGDAIRSRRAQQRERLRAAEQEAAAAREQADRAVTEERLRIARELHDVVAHSMSLIAVQAGVGAHVIRSDVAAAERSLEVIADTSRRALEQTRSMLALPHAGINRMLSVLVPLVTVAIMTFTVTPRGTRRDLWRSFGLGRSGRGVWLLSLVVPMLLLGVAYGVALLLGVAHLRPLDLSVLGVASWVVDLAIGLVIGTVFILGEEIGWRGYLLPRIQQLTSMRRAALITGFVHGCFHLPLILLATTYDEVGSRWVVAPVVVVTITAAGVFYAYLRDRSQSVWPVAVAHNAANTLFAVGASAVVATSAVKLAYVAGESGLATMGAVLLVAVPLLATARVWREDGSAREERTADALPVG